MRLLTLLYIIFWWISGPQTTLLVMAHVAPVTHSNGEPWRKKENKEVLYKEKKFHTETTSFAGVQVQPFPCHYLCTYSLIPIFLGSLLYCGKIFTAFSYSNLALVNTNVVRSVTVLPIYCLAEWLIKKQPTVIISSYKRTFAFLFDVWIVICCQALYKCISSSLQFSLSYFEQLSNLWCLHALVCS